MPDPESLESSLPGIGCSLFVMGLIGAAFGIVALSGINDRIELEFFGIELNETSGRTIWTIGCLGLAVAGWLIVKRTRRNTD